MKVLHLMAGLGEASGVANIARRFARVQNERGDSAILLAPAFKWNPIYFGLLFAIRAWWQARTADEIWVHCSWTFPVWYGAWLAKLFGKKLVVVPEGSFDPKRLHNHAGWKKRLVAPLDRWVLRQADEVLALCKDEIEWVKGFEPSAKVRFEKVPLFIKDEFLQSPSLSSTSSLHVLFLGRAEDPLKGVEYLERAVREIGLGQRSRSVVAISIDGGMDRRVLALRKIDEWLEYGNAKANLGEVTVIVRHKRNKQTPPPKFRTLTEVVETVAKHQAAGFSPSTTADSLANPIGPCKGEIGLRSMSTVDVELRIVSDHFGEELERDWAWCDVLVLPTLSENFGLVVAEALERGKKVITTDGAPAWEEGEMFECSECSNVRMGYGGRLVYLKGYRDGTDEERVELLKEALLAVAKGANVAAEISASTRRNTA